MLVHMMALDYVASDRLDYLSRFKP